MMGLFFRHLDRSFGYPPSDVVEKFQQRLKSIKTIDRYSEFVKTIKMNQAIKAPEDMLRLIRRSIEVSNQQGYTNIRSIADQQDRPRYNQRQQQSYRGKR